MNKFRQIISIIFVIIEISLTILVKYLYGGTLAFYQYTSIVLAFVFSLLFIKSNKFNYLISLALLFTLFADAFLVLCVPYQQVNGMICFCFAQIVYAIYLILKTSNKIVNIVNIVLRILLSIIMIIITKIVLKKNFDFLSAISIFYFVNIVLNAIFAFVNFKKNKLFAIGLVFFIMCDILIGLGTANGVYLHISNQTIIKLISGILAWQFYIPSQCLIALETSNFLKNK